MNRQLALGILFVVALSILAYFTLFLSDLDLFGRRPNLLVHFPEARGLREGESVTVAGMPYGRVKSLVYDGAAPEGQKITALLALDRELTLYTDYEIQIAESSFLGGHHVNIWPGTGAAPPLAAGPDEILEGSIAPSPLDAIGTLGDSLRDAQERIDNILTNVDGLISDARAGKGLVGMLIANDDLAEDAARGISAFADTMADTREITADLAAGRGTIGRLLKEEGIADQAEVLLAEVKSLLDDVSAGQGTVGLLLKDPTTRDEVARLVSNLEEVTSKVRAGEGTLGRIVVGDTVADQLESFLTSLNSTEGTLGALMHSRELYDQLSVAVADVRAVSSALAQGDGSLGRLIMDSELYDEALVGMRLLNRSLEDYREAAPIGTFTSVLFSAF